MPGFDGTGPKGLGPMTGRGMGYCVLPLSGSGDSRVHGSAGINGMPVSTTNRYTTGVRYSRRSVPYIPFRRPWLGMRFGNGWGRGFGRGQVRGRDRWSY